MRRGSVFKRCRKCGRRVDGTTCPCGSRSIGWYITVDVNPPGAPRRQVSRGSFPTKAAAVAELNELQHEHQAGRAVEPSSVTVSQLLAQWLEHVPFGAVRDTTWQNRRVYVEHYINPHIGDLPMQQLTRSDLHDTYLKLATSGRARGGGGLAPASVHSVHLALHAALEWAVERQLVVRNVADGAHKLTDPGDPEAWTEVELAQFLKVASDDDLYPLWRLLAMSGLRLGEALGLRWRDIDFRRGRIVVRQTRSKGVDGRIRSGTPKTQRGRRTLDLDAETMRVLERYRAHNQPYASPDGLVLLVPCSQKPLHPDGVRNRFDRLVQKAGLPRLTPHGLRDTHATLLLQQGEALHVVSRRLGHANEAFTARRYAAVLPGQQADAINRLAERLRDEVENDRDSGQPG